MHTNLRACPWQGKGWSQGWGTISGDRVRITVDTEFTARYRHTMDTRFEAGIQRLREAVLTGPGTLDRDLRAAAYQALDDPGPLAAYAKQISSQASEVTDDHVLALRNAGFSEDQVFEATVCAAVGAGLTRLQRGLEALKSTERA